MTGEAIIKCRLLCGWQVYAGKPVMETLGAIHERNAHEAKCAGINPPARIDKGAVDTRNYGHEIAQRP